MSTQSRQECRIRCRILRLIIKFLHALEFDYKGKTLKMSLHKKHFKVEKILMYLFHIDILPMMFSEGPAGFLYNFNPSLNG